MAREGTPIQVEDYDFSKNGWDKYRDWYDSQIASLEKNTDPEAKDLTGSIVRFPVADGYAVYVVTKHRPLTLSVVFIGDSYQALPATIRGTTEAEIRQQLRIQEFLRTEQSK